ncbi:hypothetical protein [Bacillus sp. PK5-004]
MSNKYPKLNITDEALAKLNIPRIVESNQNLNAAIRNTTAHLNEIYNQVQETNRAKFQREEESHEALLQIAENTKGIEQIISLVRKNNEINEQTFQLLQEVFTVITAETPEQADGILRSAMDKANQANESWGTIQTVIGYGKMLGKLTFPESNLFD